MPTYGYRCTVCSTEFERFQKMSDPPITECPECGGKVKKLLYPVGIQFKGDGFYVNDYANSNKSTAAKTDSTPAKSETSSTDTTPAATPAPTPPASGTK